MACIRSPQTDSDLDDIWYYVASESSSLEIADRLVDSITEQFLLLAQYPHIGRRRDEDLRPGLRSFPVLDYVIFYRVQDVDVVILRVLHGSRDVKAQFGR
ncbi:MAG: type II toxin-antitoxin system RelE/ParE family toxin [Candidatus Acidiferrales bacterium]